MEHITINIGQKQLQALYRLLAVELMRLMEDADGIDFFKLPQDFLILTINLELNEYLFLKAWKKQDKKTVKLKLSRSQALAFYSLWFEVDYFPEYESVALYQIIQAIYQYFQNTKNKIFNYETTNIAPQDYLD